MSSFPFDCAQGQNERGLFMQSAAKHPGKRAEPYVLRRFKLRKEQKKRSLSLRFGGFMS